MSLKIKDCMVEAPVQIDQKENIATAIQLMQQHGIRHLPVMRGEKVIGVVSDRDIKLVLGLKIISVHRDKVKAIYSPALYQVSPQTSVAKVAKEMEKNKYGCAVVVQRGKLVGIFSVVDALRVLSDVLSSKKTKRKKK